MCIRDRLSTNGSYSGTSNLLLYLRMQQNLNDSDASYDFSDDGIDPGNFNADPID